jgi:hypothetical protein
MRKAPKTIPRNPATSILRRVTTKLNRLPIPINSKRKSPAKKKSVKGEFTRIAVDVPLLCPLGSIRNNIPPVIAPIARITWMMQRIQFRFAFIFIGQNGYWVLGIRYWVLSVKEEVNNAIYVVNKSQIASANLWLQGSFH